MLRPALSLHRLLEKLMTKNVKICEVVSVFDLAPMDAGEASESFKFRIEVLKDLGKKRSFFARIYRRETLRVQTTFPIIKGRSRGFLADHEILVVDDALGSTSFRASNPKSVVRKVRKRIAEVFGRKATG
jgi:hypothetical protein